MKRGASRVIVIILLILVILLGALIGGMIWFINSHIFVAGKAYAKDTQVLNLRDQALTMSEYDQLCQALPDCQILWSVPFQDRTYPDDIQELSVSHLSESDVIQLSRFPRLEAVKAEGCRDYEVLMALKERYPQLQLTYTVTIGGQEYDQDTTAVACDSLTDEDITMMAYLPRLQSVDASGCRDYDRLGVLSAAFPELNVSYQVELLGQTFTQDTVSAIFRDPDVEVLMEQLAYVSHLETVHLEQPSADAARLIALTKAYPDIAFSWNKTVLGKTYSSNDTEFDFSGMQLNSPLAVEQAMAYFPNAEKVIMSNCGIDNETMAAFREKMRPEYKVVWTVYITKKPIRTDAIVIHSSALKVCFIDEMSQDLKYCEDAVVVDIGHSYVKNIEWVRYMPNLEYLILAHNWIKDLTPISSCKKLIYLEIFWNEHIPDYTPLQGCTALKDLNLSGTYADLEPLKKMTWLDNLWANCCGITEREYAELSAALPDTHIEYQGGDYTSYGWRDLQTYFDMREIMGLPRNHW